MSEFDYPQAQLPGAEPLLHSAAATQIEQELKELFAELFAHVGKDTFDAGVLGAAHLGSFDLVRKMVNHDGLVLLKGSREESATRYLYRAWKSGDVQKRGLHFVRTYLQLLFPGQASVRQMWHDRRFPYGTAFIANSARDPYWYHFLGKAGLRLDGSWKVGRSLLIDNPEPPFHAPEEENLFLTSRIEILLGLEALASGENTLEGARRTATSGLLEVVRAVIPARLVPVFRFWLRFVLAVQVRSSMTLGMGKNSRMRYPWCGRVITDSDDATWSLGNDGRIVRLPLPMGSFRLGQRVGAKSVWRLKGCRIESSAALAISGDASAYRVPMLGEPWRRLDGTWALGRRAGDAMSTAWLEKKVEATQTIDCQTGFAEQIRLDYPRTPRRLGAARRLGEGIGLNGQYRLSHAWAGQKLNGSFRLTQQGIAVEQSLAASITDSALAAQPNRLGQRDLTLSGAWAVGGRLIAEDYLLNATITGTALPLSMALETTFAERIEIDYPGAIRLGRRWQLGRGWRLDGGTKLGSQHEARKLGRFRLGQHGVVASYEAQASIQAEASTLPVMRLPMGGVFKLRAEQRKLDGGWRLGAFTRFGRFRLDGTRLRARKITKFPAIGSFTLSLNEFAGLAPLGKSRRTPLDGTWRLGARASRIEFFITVNRD